MSKVKNKTLLKQGLNELARQIRQGENRSRKNDKRAGVESQYIYTRRSYEINRDEWKRFVRWTEQQGIKIRNLSKLKKETVRKYIEYEAEHGGRDGRGAMPKTLKTKISAVNKVMVGAERWTEEEKITLTGLNEENKIEMRSDAKYGAYKRLNAKEWVNTHKEAYKANKELLDTIMGFGLRAREIRDLNTKSFFVDSNGKIWVETVGKGGKYRRVEATNKMNERMKELYGKYARPVNEMSERECRRAIKKGSKLNIKGANGHNLPKHIFRAEYAQQTVSEKIEEYTTGKEKKKGYVRLSESQAMTGDYKVKIGTFEGNAKAFWETSRMLGHNRLDVMKVYLEA